MQVVLFLTRWFENICALSLARFVFVFLNFDVGLMALKFVSKSTFTPEEIAAALELEPALESLLRSLKVDELVLTAMRFNEITERSVCAEVAQDESKMRKCGAAFGIDPAEDADFHH